MASLRIDLTGCKYMYMCQLFNAGNSFTFIPLNSDHSQIPGLFAYCLDKRTQHPSFDLTVGQQMCASVMAVHLVEQFC